MLLCTVYFYSKIPRILNSKKLNLNMRHDQHRNISQNDLYTMNFVLSLTRALSVTLMLSQWERPLWMNASRNVTLHTEWGVRARKLSWDQLFSFCAFCAENTRSLCLEKKQTSLMQFFLKTKHVKHTTPELFAVPPSEWSVTASHVCLLRVLYSEVSLHNTYNITRFKAGKLTEHNTSI